MLPNRFDSKFAVGLDDLEIVNPTGVKYSEAQARDDHGRWTSGGAPTGALEIPENGWVSQNNLVAATYPHVGLSPKAKDVASRIKDVKQESVTVTPEGSQVTTHSGTYTDKQGKQFSLTLTETIDNEHRVDGRVESGSAFLKYNSLDPARIGLDMPMQVSRIASIGADAPGSGLATAMLEFARMHSVTPVLHSTSTTPEGQAFAESTKYTESQARDSHGRWTSAGYPTWDDLNEGQQSALTEYQTSSYKIVNNYLRQGVVFETGDILGTLSPKEELDQHVNNLDSLIEFTPGLNKDTTLYRGVQGQLADDLLKLKPGDTFTDKGFNSTSHDKGQAQDFAQAGTLITIKAPKGTKGLDVDKLFDEPFEAEVILPRNTKFTVDSIKGKEMFVSVKNG